jgi:hypothetical protein
MGNILILHCLTNMVFGNSYAIEILIECTAGLFTIKPGYL